MVDRGDDLFLFGDDFEAILDILDEDEVLQEQFSTSASEVQSSEIVCSDCGKKYKTRGGYQRHRAAKHSPNPNEHRLTLTPSILAEIVRNALKNIYQREVFAEELREELKQYEYAVLEEGTQEFSVMKALFEGYSKLGMLRNSMATIMLKYH